MMTTESDLASPISVTSSASSTTSSDLSPKKMEDKTSYRKSNKPMMEKKRRARINSCLTQLKSLVLQAMKKDNSQYSKLEKADILELTVKHLKNVQRCQASSMSQVPDAMSKYRAGFNECANEVIRYLGESQGVNDDARTRILSHLASILNPVNSLALQPAHTPILPAPSSAQQQHLLQQLQLQQQQSVFLAPPGQSLSLDTNSNINCSRVPIVHHSAFVTPGTMEMKQVISGSPTAFQSPIATAVNVSSSLQLPCIATAAMATTQLQLVPGTLSSGQVALVLAPQHFPAINTAYAVQPNGRSQVCHDPLKLGHNPVKVGHIATKMQQQQVSRLDDSKVGPTPGDDKPVPLVTKASRPQRLDNLSRSASPYQPRVPPSPSGTAAHAGAPITNQAEGQRHLDVVTTTTTTSTHMPRTVAPAIIISANSLNTTSPGCSLVRSTSTWRPW